jgi:hypothetical protein
MGSKPDPCQWLDSIALGVIRDDGVAVGARVTA